MPTPKAPPLTGNGQAAVLPTADLALYYRNPRIGDVKIIAESLERNAQYRPIVVNRGTETGRPNEVLAGNHTLLAARTLGWPSIQTWLIDVDEEQAARIVAADNRTADLGSYDEVELLALLDDLAPDLSGTGYTEDDLARILRLQSSLADDATAEAEWADAGLADLENENKGGVYHVHVSFATTEDYEDFRHRLELQMAPRTRIWFPEQPNLIESDSELVAVEAV